MFLFVLVCYFVLFWFVVSSLVLKKCQLFYLCMFVRMYAFVCVCFLLGGRVKQCFVFLCLQFVSLLFFVYCTCVCLGPCCVAYVLYECMLALFLFVALLSFVCVCVLGVYRLCVFVCCLFYFVVFVFVCVLFFVSQFYGCCVFVRMFENVSCFVCCMFVCLYVLVRFLLGCRVCYLLYVSVLFAQFVFFVVFLLCVCWGMFYCLCVFCMLV